MWYMLDIVSSEEALSVNVLLYRPQFSMVTVNTLQTNLSLPRRIQQCCLKRVGQYCSNPLVAIAFACPQKRAGPILFKLFGRLRSLSLSIIMISGNFYSLDSFREIFHHHFMCSADSCVFSNALQIETLHLLNLCTLWIWCNCWGLVLGILFIFSEIMLSRTVFWLGRPGFIAQAKWFKGRWLLPALLLMDF